MIVIAFIAVLVLAALIAWAGMRQRQRGGEPVTRFDIEYGSLRRGLSKDMNPGRDDRW